MAGGESCLMADIEQRDLLAEQQRATDVLGGDGGTGHVAEDPGKDSYEKARLQLALQPPPSNLRGSNRKSFS
jgi:hypothetical protein